jgi:autotransporter-associated beta strand protein
MFRTASRHQRKKTSFRHLRLSALTTYRPVLEYLEQRWLPSTNNFWIDGVAGNWNTAGNWSLGHVPTLGEIAVFTVAQGNCTIDSGTDTCDGVNVQAIYMGAIAQQHDLKLGAAGFTLSNGTYSANSFRISLTGNWLLSGGIFNPGTGTVDFTGTATQTVNNGNSAFDNLTHSGTGTLQAMTSALTVAGALTVSAGAFDPNGLNATIVGLTTITSSALSNSGGADTLTLNGGFSMVGGKLSSGVGTIILGSGATATSDVNGPATVGGTLNLGGANRTFTVNPGLSSPDLVVAALVQNGGLTKAGSGVMVLSSANSYSGGTAVNAGTLSVTADKALGPGSGGTTVAAGAFLIFSGGVTYATTEPVTLTGTSPSGTSGGAIRSDTNTGTDSFAGSITLIAANNSIGALSGSTLVLNGPINEGAFGLTVSDTGNVTFNNAISGTSTATLTQQGTGTLTLNAANTYGGGTTVAGGTLAVGNDSALGSGPVTLGNGTTIIAVGASHSLADAVTLGGAVTVGGTNGLAFTGNIGGGTGSLIQTDTGTLLLSGTNSYGLGTTVDAGILAVGNDSALGSGSLTLNAGTIIFAAGGGHVLANAVTLGGAATVAGSNDLTLNGIVSGNAGSLTQTDTATLTLNGTNTFGGGVTVNAGILAAGNDSALGSGSLTLNDGSTIQAAGTAHSLSNGATFNNRVTVTGSLNLTFTGVIGGSGTLTKVGTGTAAFSGNNTYSGTINVNAGTLFINGSQPNSPITVNPTATFGGTGTVGTITVSGGTLSPGTTGPGILTAANVQFTSGAFAVLFSGPAPGTGFGQLAVTATINLGSGVASLSIVGPYHPVAGNSFRIIDNLSASPTSGTFANLSEGATLLVNGTTLQITYKGGTGNDVVLATTKSDIAGRVSSSGEWWVGLSTGSSFANSKWTNWNPNVTWVDVQTGDFTGDGHEDIVGRVLQSGEWWVAVSNGSNGFTSSKWDTWSPNVTWVDVKVGDFNGDGKMDITGRVLQSGEWWTGVSTGSSFTTSKWAAWSTVVTWADVQVGDFSGDGKADIAGRALQSGEWWVGVSSGSSFAASKWATWSPAVTWVDVRVGDFNGDGKADITGRVSQSGEWWTGLSNGSIFNTTRWAIWNPNVTWVDVRVGDFDGNGKSDITGRVLQTGEWWTALSTGSSFNTTLWDTWSPNVTWVDVQVGDFNGDGKADITGRVLGSGEWWTAVSSGSSFTTAKWTTWSASVSWVNVENGQYV